MPYANKEDRNANERKKYALNREKESARKKAYRIANPEKSREVMKRAEQKYEDTHKEERKKKNERDRKKRPELYAFITATRRAIKHRATPLWSDLNKIKSIYEHAKIITIKTGIIHHVDHYYPLKSKYGSGLHVPENLRIITGTENAKKRNKWPMDEQA